MHIRELREGEKVDWLQLVRSGIKPITILTLLRLHKTPSAVLQNIDRYIARLANSNIKICSRAKAEREYHRLREFGGGLLTIEDSGYPPLLRHIPSPPMVLSYKGDYSLLGRDMLAVVGSRNVSFATLKITEDIAKGLAVGGYVVISGMAKGVDAAAHKILADCGMPSVGVLGSGINQRYPAVNDKLYDEVLDNGGLLISQFPFGCSPVAANFPNRNRIIVGASCATVVTAARRRSGALISAGLAANYGRDVMVVPGSPLDDSSVGNNDLIRSGAILVCSADDVLSEVRSAKSVYKAQIELFEDVQDGLGLGGVVSYGDAETDSVKDIIMRHMTVTPVCVDDIIRYTGVSPQLVLVALVELELEGKIERGCMNRAALCVTK